DVKATISKDLLIKQFVAQNLVKLGLIGEEDLVNADLTILAQTLYTFIEEVETKAQETLSRRQK
ncbi:MAG: hypothetical protein UY18_C0003G0042, partial [Microgenomates group bacterium GW2011_GWF2_47_9]